LPLLHTVATVNIVKTSNSLNGVGGGGGKKKKKKKEGGKKKKKNIKKNNME